jgi:hypothetical protein
MQGGDIFLVHCTPPPPMKYQVDTTNTLRDMLQTKMSDGRTDRLIDRRTDRRRETKLYFEFQVNIVYSKYLITYCLDKK